MNTLYMMREGPRRVSRQLPVLTRGPEPEGSCRAILYSINKQPKRGPFASGRTLPHLNPTHEDSTDLRPGGELAGSVWSTFGAPWRCCDCVWVLRTPLARTMTALVVASARAATFEWAGTLGTRPLQRASGLPQSVDGASVEPGMKMVGRKQERNACRELLLNVEPVMHIRPTAQGGRTARPQWPGTQPTISAAAPCASR